MSPLLTIALRFAVLSLLAVGGVTSVLPEVHRVVVDVHGWLTDAEFTRMFALAQANPGPNMLIVTLIGWRVAGLPGALTATSSASGSGLPARPPAAPSRPGWRRSRSD